MKVSKTGKNSKKQSRM